MRYSHIAARYIGNLFSIPIEQTTFIVFLLTYDVLLRLPIIGFYLGLKICNKYILPIAVRLFPNVFEYVDIDDTGKVKEE